MKIEYQLNSVQIDSQEFQDQLYALISVMSSSLPKKKKRKRRKQKEKKTVGPLIQEIIDSIEI